jgi:hypothetical protein
MISIYFKSWIKLAFNYLTGAAYWNYRLYSKHQRDTNTAGALKCNRENNFAIMMQGQVVEESNFTIETLKFYRSNFPAAILILSTWDITEGDRRALEQLEVHIIQNEKPENPGIANVNLQIVTSRAGVRAAQGLGVEYLLKTRTDQRVYHPSMDAYLFSLMEAFPLTGNYQKQRDRLVGISLNTFKYRMYGISDMFLFGHIDDMALYWDLPLDERRNTPAENQKAGRTWREFALWGVCEVYFCTNYLEKVGRKVSYSLADSYDALAEHFLIIDQDALQLYWHKYTINRDRHSKLGYLSPEMSFNDWLVLYQSMERVIVDEAALDQPISKDQ